MIMLIRPAVLPNMQQHIPPGWTTTCLWLATVTGTHTRIRGKRQLTITVNGVMVEHEVWTADMVKPCILGLDTLGCLGRQWRSRRNSLMLWGADCPSRAAKGLTQWWTGITFDMKCGFICSEKWEVHTHDLQHRIGWQHCNADTLSCLPCMDGECRYHRRMEEKTSGAERSISCTDATLNVQPGAQICLDLAWVYLVTSLIKITLYFLHHMWDQIWTVGCFTCTFFYFLTPSLRASDYFWLLKVVV